METSISSSGSFFESIFVIRWCSKPGVIIYLVCCKFYSAVAIYLVCVIVALVGYQLSGASLLKI